MLTNLLMKSLELGSISLQSIGRKIKQDLEMIYKRVTILNSKSGSSESNLKTIRSALVIKTLIDQNIEVIFLSECSI